MKEESKLIELFKKYPGIAARIRRSFAYHYDQIQREIESEVATINKDDAATIIDYTTEYMEESMNCPAPRTAPAMLSALGAAPAGQGYPSLLLQTR